MNNSILFWFIKIFLELSEILPRAFISKTLDPKYSMKTVFWNNPKVLKIINLFFCHRTKFGREKSLGMVLKYSPLKPNFVYLNNNRIGFVCLRSLHGQLKYLLSQCPKTLNRTWITQNHHQSQTVQKTTRTCLCSCAC